MSTSVRVDPFLLVADGTTVSSISSDVTTAWSTLASTLRANQGMAGDDESAEVWAPNYDTIAENMGVHLTSAVAGLRGLDGMLTGTGATYHQAELNGVDGSSTSITVDEPQSFDPGSVPTSLGTGLPGTLGEIQEVLEGFLASAGIVFPRGDSAKLRAVAGDWQSFATTISSARSSLSGALVGAAASELPQSSKITSAQSTIEEVLQDAQDTAGEAAGALEAAAQSIDDTWEELSEIGKQLAIELAIDVGISAALSVVTFGLGAIAGAAKATHTILKWVDRIADAIRRLKAIQRIPADKLLRAANRLRKLQKGTLRQRILFEVGKGTVASVAATVIVKGDELTAPELFGALAGGFVGSAGGSVVGAGASRALRGSGEASTALRTIAKETTSGAAGGMGGSVVGGAVDSLVQGKDFNIRQALLLGGLSGGAGGGIGGGMSLAGGATTSTTGAGGGTPTPAGGGSGNTGAGGGGTPIPDAGGAPSGTPDVSAPPAGTPAAGTPDVGGTPDAGTPDPSAPPVSSPETPAPVGGTPDAGVPDTPTTDVPGAPDSNATPTPLPTRPGSPSDPDGGDGPSLPESPVSEAPVSESPVSESPVSETPVSESPVSEAPVSETPVSDGLGGDGETPASNVPLDEAAGPPAGSDGNSVPSASDILDGINNSELPVLPDALPVDVVPSDSATMSPGDAPVGDSTGGDASPDGDGSTAGESARDAGDGVDADAGTETDGAVPSSDAASTDAAPSDVPAVTDPAVPAEVPPLQFNWQPGENQAGVRFFGPDHLPYYETPNATLGRPGDAIFMMPEGDAGAVRDALDAAIHSGMAPSALKAFQNGDPIFGVVVPLDGIATRMPTAADAGGWPHFLPGGQTAVKTDLGWIINDTREFVIDGGLPMPPGTILFKLIKGGVWEPILIYG